MKLHATLKTKLVLTALMALCLPQLGLAQGNLVDNGNFESGSIDWALINGAAISGGGNPGYAAFLVSSDSTPANQPTASQTIGGLVAGDTYTISGDYEAGKDRGGASYTNPSFGVAINGTFLYEVTTTPLGSWQSFNFSYTAASSSILLAFSSQINGTGLEYAIDNIAMDAVPEPNSLCLMGVGGMMSALFFTHRRKARRK